MVNYWLDLFNGKSWNEFRSAGAQIAGFREKRRNTLEKIEKGDILLCYVTGVMRWVGALEVIGQSSNKNKIWNKEENNEILDYPARLEVRPIILLDPEYGVPMDKLEGSVSFYQNKSDRRGFRGFIRGSPTKFSVQDGNCVFSLIKDAQKNPQFRNVDPKKLQRIPFFKIKSGNRNKTISIPEEETEFIQLKHNIPTEADQFSNLHTQIQYNLLKIGSDMGLKVWVARNDRSKVYDGVCLGNVPNTIEALPTQFNEATQKTIELIDVLWLKGNSIIAAFEVEATTSIYSGLLRMSDLIALQPNLEIKLYLVAPEGRYEKVKREILRPTFELRNKPLSMVCGYLSFSELMKKIKGIQDLGLASSLNPDFLDNIAEYFNVQD